MIDDTSKKSLMDRLDRNLQLQEDCETEIEKCQETGEEEFMKTAQDTLEILKSEEKEIRAELEN